MRFGFACILLAFICVLVGCEVSYKDPGPAETSETAQAPETNETAQAQETNETTHAQLPSTQENNGPLTPEQSCTCDLSKPFIRELRVDGERNKYEGTRFWRLSNRCSDGQWQAISPDFDWISGCIEVDGMTLTCFCDPARGAHFFGYRLAGDDDSYSAPCRKERTFTTKQPFTNVYYERRQP